MIELEINSSKDNDINGPYLSFADKLSLGKNIHADLIINDASLMPEHLKLEIIDSNLRVTPCSGSSFLLNGKKSISPRNAKVGDILKIGETTFKFVNFARSPWNIPSPQTLEEKFLTVSSTDPIREIILESLKNELQQLEYEAEYVSKNSR